MAVSSGYSKIFKNPVLQPALNAYIAGIIQTQYHMKHFLCLYKAIQKPGLINQGFFLQTVNYGIYHPVKKTSAIQPV